ncbi:unnamed protein product [Prunus armeniaca]
MHDICNYDAYFGQKCDAAGVLGLLPEQTLTAIIRIMVYGSSAGTTCTDLRPGTSNDFYKKIATRGFPGMIGSIDCMHWQGDYGNRKGQKSIILEVVVGFDTWVWHAFFGVSGSQNDLNVLGQSPVFNNVLIGEASNITYQINNTVYQTRYYLANDIYLRWTTFIKSILNPRSQKQRLFASFQEGYKKDV